jgi:hypothetical protein
MGSAAAFLSTILALAAPRPRGENVHRPDANCRTCHTADRAALQASPARARTALIPDLEATCNRCHGDQGPSHKTGMPPKTPVPALLPLAADGKVTCATCHFMHGEDNRFGDFIRIDNHRGKLCLTCHQIRELR